MAVDGKTTKKVAIAKKKVKAEAVKEEPKVEEPKAEKKAEKAEKAEKKAEKEKVKAEKPKEETKKEEKPQMTKEEKREAAKETARATWKTLRAKAAKRKASGEKKKKPELPRKTKATRLADAQADAESGSDDEDDEKKKKKAEDDREPRGVIYIGHLPRAFAEPQLRQYFSQFGRVRRIRISRSKKNAAVKGYGWVEFQQASVAKIVAQTMNGYMMFGKQLKVKLMGPDELHPALFKGCTRIMKDRTSDRQKKHTDTYNNRPTVEVDGEMVPRTSLRQEKRRSAAEKKLKARLGQLEVGFTLDDVKVAEEKTPKAVKVTAATVKAAAAAAEKAAVADGKAVAAPPMKKKRKA